MFYNLEAYTSGELNPYKPGVLFVGHRQTILFAQTNFIEKSDEN